MTSSLGNLQIDRQIRIAICSSVQKTSAHGPAGGLAGWLAAWLTVVRRGPGEWVLAIIKNYFGVFLWLWLSARFYGQLATHSSHFGICQPLLQLQLNLSATVARSMLQGGNCAQPQRCMEASWQCQLPGYMPNPGN